jgi:hypothetical protein
MKNTLFAIYLATCGTLAMAGPGHDHGTEHEATQAINSPASPRLIMEADFFEAVAVLKGQTLEIFVDHAATNTPVENAELAILINGETVPLELHDVGEFDAVVPESMTGKNLDVAMRAIVGDQSEVLTGRLELDDHPHDHHEEEHSHLLEYLATGGAALLALGFIALFLKRRSRKGKSS